MFFGKKTAKNGRNPKIVFCSILFCWEASTYQISENFIKRFRFCQFSSLLVNFGRFLTKKGQKMPKSGSVVNFHLPKGIYIPNFRKFHQTVPKIICDGRTDNKGPGVALFATGDQLLKTNYSCFQQTVLKCSRLHILDQNFNMIIIVQFWIFHLMHYLHGKLWWALTKLQKNW